MLNPCLAHISKGRKFQKKLKEKKFLLWFLNFFLGQHPFKGHSPSPGEKKKYFSRNFDMFTSKVSE